MKNILIGLSVSLSSPLFAANGLRLVQDITVKHMGQELKVSQTITLAGEEVRIESTQQGNTAVKFYRGGKKVLTCSLADKICHNMPDPPMPAPTLTKFEIKPTGESKTIAGHTCTVYKTAMEISHASTRGAVESVGCLSKFGTLDKVYGTLRATSVLKDANPDGKLREAYLKVAELGIPLEMDENTTMKQVGGPEGEQKGSSVIRTTKIEDLAVVPADTFKMPAGFKMMPQMKQQPITPPQKRK